MKVETYKCFNAQAKGKINLDEFVQEELDKVNLVFEGLNNLQADLMSEYLISYKQRLREVLSDYQVKETEEIDVTGQNLTVIGGDIEMQSLILHFLFTNLEISHFPIQKESEVLYSNQQKASRRLAYHGVKALEDIIGKEEATRNYKEVLTHVIREMKMKSKKDPPKDPRDIKRSTSRNHYITRSCRKGIGDFTIGIFDDYKEIYRFDRCIVHEVLKDFKDPDITFLSSCYVGEHPEMNKGEIIHLQRTQTLHHGEFCDELYWNNEVHPYPEQPSLEFTRSLEV
ncbi:MAG: hypothetical protein ACXAD7_14050 [Candidatus Kariarchaeaceae archaeon]|jgi:hypothetical protein